jgi:hypothetical protein
MAVEVVDRVGLAVEGGDDESRVGSPKAVVLGSYDDTTQATPALRAVAHLGEAPSAQTGALGLAPGRGEGSLCPALVDGVCRQAQRGVEVSQLGCGPRERREERRRRVVGVGSHQGAHPR